MVHVCSRIIKVVSTKLIVIISSKDRDTPASIINRANKAQQEKNKSENQIVAKEFEQQMKPNNKPSSIASEIEKCMFTCHQI